MSNAEIKKSVKVGTVISNKMDKSITVSVERKVLHPVVKKYIKKRTKFMAHDERNESKVGDKVEISQIRPMSKNKCWKLDNILEKKKVI